MWRCIERYISLYIYIYICRVWPPLEGSGVGSHGIEKKMETTLVSMVLQRGNQQEGEGEG